MILVWIASAFAGEIVTLDAALEAARQHPQVRSAAADTEAAEARARAAGGALLPQVDARASWDAATGSAGDSTSIDARVTASQLVFDFGRTPSKWAAARRSAAASALDGRDAEVSVRLGVREAYFGAVAAKALIGVAKETLDNQERHLAQVEAFVQVGTRAPIDLAKARTDRANARVALVRAQGAYEQAKAQLDAAMGVERALDFDVADAPFSAVEGEDRGSDDMVAEALRARPDVAALTTRVEAQRAQVKAAIGAYAPAITAGASAATTGATPDAMGWSAGVGLDLSAPLFEGGALHAEAREARATLTGLEADLDALRQRVRLEVETARVAVASERAAVEAAAEAVDAARQQLTLAEGRYQTGVGSAIEVGDAQLALTNALGQRVSTDYDLATARAELLAALGR